MPDALRKANCPRQGPTRLTELGGLASSDRAAEGAEHYSEMCQECHGAPGLSQSEIAKGLEPPPPKLWEGAFDDEVAKMDFWIVKNGIRMTGMPAFGTTHDDEKIWDIVAFVRKLHGMTPAQYLPATGESKSDADGKHEHGAEEHGAEHEHHDTAGEPAHEHEHEHGHEHDE